ncbi:hypothetical protein AB0M43_28015 [Longispora sp. NPDC051575]|uniref:hypothetical protein n=1 Tax=Longispora sp. NPDC051575 TaxID=3154943 RepID=UPI0034210F53
MTRVEQATRPAVVWALLRRAVSYELSMWRALYRWILRRPATTEPGARTFGYAWHVGPVLWVFIIVSAAEIPAVHLLLPWESVRGVALVLGVYGLLWMFGLLASMKVNLHVVAPSGLRIRYGPSIDVAVPWSAVASVGPRNRNLDRSRTLQTEGSALHIAVSSRTSVDIVFRAPTVLGLPGGDTEPLTELRVYADDPAGFVAAAREHLA